MDEKKINRLIDTALENPEKLNYAIEEMARREGDIDAAEFGIERLTLAVKGGGEILIVKPSPMLGNLWLFNLFSAGTLNIDNPEFELTSVADEVFRIGVKSEGLNYWVDVENEQQLKKASNFLEVEIEGTIE